MRSIAYFALLVWPVITLVLINRYRFERGVLLSLLGAYLFLPASFEIDLPAVPPLDKFTITTLTILLIMLASGRRLGINVLGKRTKLLFLLFLVSPFLTALTNTERYYYLPSLGLYDGLSDMVMNILLVLPFLIGVKYFDTYEKQIILFKYFSIAAVIYAVLALYEIRMSPQLHVMFYGFFPHSWLQQYRAGGFRAIVFMGHGLLVALFLALGLAFLASLRKINVRLLPVNNTLIVLFVLTTLILQKSLAALVFGLSALILINFMSDKRRHQAALIIGMLFISYPMLSSIEIFPHRQIISFATKIDPLRAQSLDFRFEQEKALLEHANAKPLFGWGGWGRNRARDSETGQDISTTDGKWILTLGVRGWLGYLSEFLLVLMPLWLSYRLMKKGKVGDKKQAFLLSSHAVIISVILLDQLPNASLNPLYWLVIGALLGRVYNIMSNDRQQQETRSGMSKDLNDDIKSEVKV